ncbi:MAG: 30S ribosomal protein S6 [Candidatus Omnitrophota bacterium]
MSKYELVVILDAQLEDEKKEEINNQVADAVTKSGAKIINNQLWLDKQKMAFTIKRQWEGSYYLTVFESATSVIEKVKRALSLNEDILRFAIFQSQE